MMHDTIRDQQPSHTPSMGEDHDYGYVCDDGGVPGGVVSATSWRFSDHCEFFDHVDVPTWYKWYSKSTLSLAGAVSNDYALIRLRRDNFPNGMGSGRWMAMSSINTDTGYRSKNLITYGYPADDVLVNGQFNYWDKYLYYPAYPFYVRWRLQGAEEYWTTGFAKIETTNSLLHTSLDAADGQSGSPVFYYFDNADTYTGQGYFMLGLLTGLFNEHDDNADWNGGPTVAQFRSNVIDWMAQ